jgi:hypothetical protein
MAACEVREGSLNGVFVGQQSGRSVRLPALRIQRQPSGLGAALECRNL